MKLKFENVSLGFIGDIHGDFQKLKNIVKPFTDTVFIVVGDCGFGFHDTKEDKALRYNENKPKWSYVHFKSLLPMVRVLEKGAKKYAPFN